MAKMSKVEKKERDALRGYLRKTMSDKETEKHWGEEWAPRDTDGDEGRGRYVDTSVGDLRGRGMVYGGDAWTSGPSVSTTTVGSVTSGSGVTLSGGYGTADSTISGVSGTTIGGITLGKPSPGAIRLDAGSKIFFGDEDITFLLAEAAARKKGGASYEDIKKAWDAMPANEGVELNAKSLREFPKRVLRETAEAILCSIDGVEPDGELDEKTKKLLLLYRDLIKEQIMKSVGLIGEKAEDTEDGKCDEADEAAPEISEELGLPF